MVAATSLSTPLHLRPSQCRFASSASTAMRSLPLLRRRLRSVAVAAVQQDAAVWTAAPVSSIVSASADGLLFHVAVDLSDAAGLAASYTAPGQYLLVRVPGEDGLKPAFMAIASPPGQAGFQFLVKTVPGATAGKLCGLRDGNVVELGAVTGKGFPVERISQPDVAETVLLFATGIGISQSMIVSESPTPVVSSRVWGAFHSWANRSFSARAVKSEIRSPTYPPQAPASSAPPIVTIRRKSQLDASFAMAAAAAASASASISASVHLRPSQCGFPSSAATAMRSLPLLRRRLRSVAVAAVQQDAAVWTAAPVSSIGSASADGSLFHIAVDLSDAAGLATAYTVPGQFLLVRVPGDDGLKPAFMAIASPPGQAGFEFLVKTVPGATAEKLCGLREGDVVELGAVMGKGFPVERISPPDVAETVLLFATGTGISPIRSLIEFGFAANERADVRLYYGARNLQTMAYQDRFTNWESTGLKIIPVLSRPDDSWKGERGYVQHAFLKAKNITNPASTGAVLCGQNQMIEEVTSALVEDGVSQDKILTNY